MNQFAQKVNFFATSFVGVLGFTLLSEVIQEDDFPDKIDDALLFLLALVSIWWYKKSGANSSSAKTSVLIIGLGLVIKFLGIYIERGDKDALGDDIGVGIAFLLAFLYTLYLVFFHKSSTK